MSAVFAYFCDNATKMCCTSIVVHNYANDKRMAKFIKTTKKAPLPQRVEVLTYILSNKVGIKAHIKAVMTEVEADLKGEVFFKAVYHIGLEAWVMVAVIVFVFIYEQIKLATLVHIHATLLGIL